MPHGLEGTIIDDRSADWPDFIGVQWDNGDRTFAAPTHIRIEKKEDRDALAKEHATAVKPAPSKEQIHLKCSNITIPAGYAQAEPGSPVFMADVIEGRGHHIYREFDRSTNEYNLHFELDLDRDLSPSESIVLAQNILKLAVPMQEDQQSRAEAGTPTIPAWADTAHYDAETDTLSGRGPSIHLNDGRQKWDIHSSWFEGGDEQFTMAKRFMDQGEFANSPDECFSFSSREEVMTVMASLVSLVAAITEGAK
ncbi:hypothetical protein [Arthrobacter sp. ERGS1:01]|uniref:hypothetical protein n=1 Tax=Arthrobacter sp. ERGS1:01 TaxID=1704044 RepID=UPI0012375294|nr:hypothetical protein [Arthrobacter sp. ERGS1:01]